MNQQPQGSRTTLLYPNGQSLSISRMRRRRVIFLLGIITLSMSGAMVLPTFVPKAAHRVHTFPGVSVNVVPALPGFSQTFS